MSKKTLPKGIYAITDPNLLPETDLLPGVEAALRGGVRVIQYRNKRASDKTKLDEAKALLSLCEAHDAKLIINDSVELCMESGAHGVHLGKSDGSVTKARKLLGETKIVGVTCHNDIEYALQCTALGASYVAFGRLFPSKTKPDAPACSLDILRSAVQQNLHCVGIGGITTHNISNVRDTGAQMAAVIHDLFGHKEIELQAQTLQQKFISQE